MAPSAAHFFRRSLGGSAYRQFVGVRTPEHAVERFGPRARARLLPFFRERGIPYPPRAIALLAIKDQALLELWAEADAGPRRIRSYPILALSGRAGPKLREGDRQVPEGLYRIVGFNPNSAYHLSMKLDYPNGFDSRQAAAEGRTDPGSNIFIHGKAASVGCLAVGDRSIEELFVLARDVGETNIRVAIAPTDPRAGPLPVDAGPVWVAELYRNIESYFASYKLRESAHLPAATGPRGG